MFRLFWEDLKHQVLGWVRALGGLIFEFFTHYNEISSDVLEIVASFEALKKNIGVEAEKLRNFEFNPHWSSRVINVPIAINQIRDLVEQIHSVWTDKFDDLKRPFHELSLLLHQESEPDPQDPGRAINSLTKAQVKLGHVAVTIHEFKTVMDDISDVVDLFDRIREDIQSLDDIFLQQGNPRQRVKETRSKRVPV